jgi:hypothetical protein
VNRSPVEISKTPIQPMDCINSGWLLIKDRYWLFLGITFVGMMIGSASMYICLGAMLCGIFIALFAKMRGEAVDFGTLFKGFDVFVPSLIPLIIIIVIGAALVGPLYIKMFSDMENIVLDIGMHEEPFAFLKALAIDMGKMMARLSCLNILYFFLFFCFQLIADRRADGLAAMGLSFKAVLKNFWGVLGLFLLLGLINFVVSILTCLIGGIFFAPVKYAAMAVAYTKIFPAEPPGLPETVPPAPEI